MPVFLIPSTKKESLCADMGIAYVIRAITGRGVSLQHPEPIGYIRWSPAQNHASRVPCTAPFPV